MVSYLETDGWKVTMKQAAGIKSLDECDGAAGSDLETLLDVVGTPVGGEGIRINGARVGTLIAFADNGAIPLVTYPGQPGTAALPARATLDLHGAHVGRGAVLIFDEGDPHKPIIIGCLRAADADSRALPQMPGQVEVDADGERLVVSAKQQMVLRCGKASITLTKAGKVLIEGAYVSNRSTGVLRLKGGSVQIN